MEINWPIEAGMGTLNCDADTACGNVNFPPPNPNIPYTVICDSERECEAADILCPTNASCTVNCNDKKSCLNVCNVYLYIIW